MNSLRSLGRAIEYEADRQIRLITEGGTVVQETRHWDEGAGRTGSMRSKEEAYDYRYFPEPDLVPVDPSADWIAEVGRNLPIMPAARRHSVARVSGLEVDSDAVATVVNLGLDGYVDAVVSAGGTREAASVAVRRLANEVAAEIDSLTRLAPGAFARLVTMESEGALTTSQARTVLKQLLAGGGDPDQIAAELGFEAMERGDLEATVDRVIAEHRDEWSRYQAGEDKLTGFFIGHIKAATEGKADLKAASAMLRSRRS
jgi:aspartyl-tRNA(Asn)/glutamyl-tRNA(Gln) amidotransferase subunit B